ncbi:hypothetical protein BU17DRAFT_60458 [Hysterangium stoloniferum]|nr:hypothetical protein BU17DRAFT_60458 [Hysterangium stoloniferum]
MSNVGIFVTLEERWMGILEYQPLETFNNFNNDLPCKEFSPHTFGILPWSEEALGSALLNPTIDLTRVLSTTWGCLCMRKCNEGSVAHPSTLRRTSARVNNNSHSWLLDSKLCDSGKDRFIDLSEIIVTRNSTLLSTLLSTPNTESLQPPKSTPWPSKLWLATLDIWPMFIFLTSTHGLNPLYSIPQLSPYLQAVELTAHLRRFVTHALTCYIKMCGYGLHILLVTSWFPLHQWSILNFLSFVAKELFGPSLLPAPVAHMSSSSKFMAFFKVVIGGKIDPYDANVIVNLFPVSVSSQLILRTCYRQSLAPVRGSLWKMLPAIPYMLAQTPMPADIMDQVISLFSGVEYSLEAEACPMVTSRHIRNICYQALCVAARATGMMLFWLLIIAATIGCQLLKSILWCTRTVSAQRSYSLADIMSCPLLVPILVIRNPIAVLPAPIQATVNGANTHREAQPVVPANTDLPENINKEDGEEFNNEEMSRNMSISPSGPIDGPRVDTEFVIGEINITSATTAELTPSPATPGPTLSTAIAELTPAASTSKTISSTATAADPTPVAPANTNTDDDDDEEFNDEEMSRTMHASSSGPIDGPRVDTEFVIGEINITSATTAELIPSPATPGPTLSTAIAELTPAASTSKTISSTATAADPTPVAPANTNTDDDNDDDEEFNDEEMSRTMHASSSGPIDGPRVDTEFVIGEINITSATTAELIPSPATPGPTLSTAIAELTPATSTSKTISSTATAADPTPIAPAYINTDDDNDEEFNDEEMSRTMHASLCGPIDSLRVDTEFVIGEINITSATTAELISSPATPGPILSTAIAELTPATSTSETISSTATAADPTPVAPANINKDDDNDKEFNYEEMSREMRASSCGPIDGLPVVTEAIIGQNNITSPTTAELIPSPATPGPILSTPITQLIPSTATSKLISSTATSADPTPVAPANINKDDDDDKEFNYEEISREMRASSCGPIDGLPVVTEAIIGQNNITSPTTAELIPSPATPGLILSTAITQLIPSTATSKLISSTATSADSTPVAPENINEDHDDEFNYEEMSHDMSDSSSGHRMEGAATTHSTQLEPEDVNPKARLVQALVFENKLCLFPAWVQWGIRARDCWEFPTGWYRSQGDIGVETYRADLRLDRAPARTIQNDTCLPLVPTSGFRSKLSSYLGAYELVRANPANGDPASM